MQSATSNFTQAMTGSSGVWAPPQVLADWAGDGYDLVKTPDIRDYFNRSHTGGWGQADSGHIWTPLVTPVTDFFVTSGAATISMSALSHHPIVVGGMVTDFDVMFRVSTSQLATGQAQRASVIGRVVDSGTFYLLRCDFNIDQVVGWGMEHYVSGVEVQFASGLVSGITHAVGRKFWIRGQGIGNTFRVKVWQDGTDQPATWSGTGTDSTLTGPGQVGIRASVVSGNTNTAPLVYTISAFANGAWDDLTDQASTIAVHQALDDGLPSDITYTSGSDSTSSATVSVGGRAGLPAQQYWSPDRADSPIAPYERDIPPTRVALGAVTAAGIERVTVFTGQMSDAPVDGVTATLDAVSTARLKLTQRVQPPPIVGDTAGLTGSWPVSWALAQCGIYVSPPPRTGCLWWSPMHGSLRPFLTAPLPNSEIDIGFVGFADGTFSESLRPTFVDGPYLQGVYAQVQTAQVVEPLQQGLAFVTGTPCFSTGGNAGRLEFWVRTDAVNLSTPAPALGGIPFLVFLTLADTSPSTVKLQAGVDTTYHPFITINDGSNTTTFTGSALAQDGEWHFVGAAWDVAHNKLWLASDSSTTTKTPSPAMTTAHMQAVDTHDTGHPSMTYFLPTAEVQITSGAQASPDNFVWINDGSYFTPSAVMRPSILNLAALAVTQPVEAASFIADYAQAELAVTRTDESDRYCYLPMPYWAEAEQQIVAETLSTAANVGPDWTTSRDLTKRRNQVVVSYTDTRVSNPLFGAPADVSLSFTVYTLAPGTSTLTVPLTYPTVGLFDTIFHLATDTDVANGDIPAGANFFCANTVNDGSGTFATSTQITANITAWDPSRVVITVLNTSSTTYYTANSSILPYIAIRGTYAITADVSVTVQSDDDVAKRGVRGLTADLSAIQDQQAATAIAGELLARAKIARRQMTMTVRGDPRRQPGDLVRVTDPNGTNADGLWRVLTIGHNTDGASYTQTLTLVESALIGVWDQSKWDDGSIWGP